MHTLDFIDPAEATGKAKNLLDAIQKKLGKTPNFTRALANSPAALEAYLHFSDALAGGFLSAQLREQIALIVAEINNCQYCLSAHSSIGQIVGLSEEEISNARRASSTDLKSDAALKFVRALVLQRGEVSQDDLHGARNAGFADGEIVEIVSNVALSIFINYFSHVARTEIDFPQVDSNARHAI